MPNGLLQVSVIAANFIGNDKVALVLGDDIFYRAGFTKSVQSFYNINDEVVFAFEVNHPERYSVAEFDANHS
jgi:glucose-1-phosphate thymidylyltransferase